jgi:hypothetical protein
MLEKARRRLIVKILSSVGLAAFLAACATTSELKPQEPMVIAPAMSILVPPPGGPAVVSVVQTTFPNAVKHDVFLETTARTIGENKISIIRFVGKGGDGSDAGLVDTPFTRVNLTEEALAAWPNSGMAVSPFFVQNNYGPFGYAIAKPGNGDVCIYAWQRIEASLRPSGAVDRGSINVRLQLCRRGVTEAQLLEIMYQLRLNTGVFPPGKAPLQIGANLSPIRPLGVEGFAEVIPTGRPAARASTAAPAAVRPVVPAVVAPISGPIVPSPTSRPGGAGPMVPRPPASISSPGSAGATPSTPGVIVPSPPVSTR